LRGLDSDNDSAFINYYLLKWSQENRIVFTRSRPYRKNDNCHVEQKNWSIARRFLGYFRYDTDQALEVLEKLSKLLSLYVNFFQVSVKLKKKIRSGSKIKKVYDEPKTPFERVTEHPMVSEEVKEKLLKRYDRLNPAELRRKIFKLQEKLFRLTTPVRGKFYE